MLEDMRSRRDQEHRRIPFGRYESSDGAEWPANEFLVGREPGRRRLLDLLFTHGKRSAYLVTGQRGSGKTAFVDFCLHEYRLDVFGRFLKSNVGRSIYDRTGLAVIVCLLGILALMLKELLWFFLREWQPEPNNRLGWVPAIPIILAFLYPVMAARGLLDVASDWRTDALLVSPSVPGRPRDRVADWLYKWRGTLILFALVTGGAALRPLRESISHAGPILACLWAMTVILGQCCALRIPDTNPGRPLARAAFFSRITLVVVLVLILVGGYTDAYPWHDWVEGWLTQRGALAHKDELVAVVVVAVSFLAEFVGRFLGRPSQLGDWAGRRGRKPLFIRERAVLAFKGISLVTISAYLVVEPFIRSDSQVSRSALFDHELPVLGLVVLLFVSIARIEYNWIVRHHLRTKSGISFDKRRLDEAHVDAERYARQLVAHTSFAFLYAWWLPVLVVKVNLGVEALDHRRVIEAMLTGLRDAYERTFLHWRSALANAGRALRLMILIATTTLLGDHFFASSVRSAYHCDDTCTYRPRVSEILCLGGETGASISRALQFQFIWPRRDTTVWEGPCRDDPQALGAEETRKARDTRRESIAQIILPTSIQSKTLPDGTRAFRHEIDVRLYHVILFLMLLLIARLVERKWPVFPYRTTLRDIDDALASLSSKLTLERGLEVKLGSETLAVGSKRGQVTDPLDPRTVELLFLRLLRQIDEAALRLPFVAGAHVSVPVPDVFFVFDELDKLGTRRAATAPSPGSDEGPAVGNDEERERSLTLKNLFSDLKNILSSAPARFIFVGGRNLHDEWLADQTSRQPLLTRLFAAEIYVPSFLTDRPTDDLSSGIQLYLRAQLRRARLLYDVWMTSRVFRWLRHAPRDKIQPVFITPRALSTAPLPSIRDGSGVAKNPALNSDFVAFLTYRSMGNVKRLKELLEGFIEQIPEGSSGAGDGGEPFTHALVLRGGDVHRVQLIADIYRGLLRTFGAGIWRDDKLAPAVFYVADFLLKFHRRAFTWNNLERIDELVHVHRAPELRKVLHTIVDAWTGTLLHPIRNGMYDYRFRIETALELRLASRRSDEEMAALNFTLDEAQDIKDLYRRRLAAAHDPATFEFEAVLGELHDLDEEYDLARYRYRRAIQLLDEQIVKDLIGTLPAQSIDAEKGSILRRVLAGDPQLISAVRRRAHWAVSRLRLMLQIALTHERTRDFESAALKYRNARALAETLVTFAGQSGKDGIKHAQEEEYELLKHVNLLFQPAFAEAWVSEKAGRLIDAPVALVERTIDSARNHLPFVCQPSAARQRAESPTNIKHAVFALTVAELHDKAGDLLFFKGKSPGRNAKPGYLDRAHFHYARSLHELRSYNTYRRESAPYKLGLTGHITPDDRPELFRRGAAPDFALQIAAGSLADLAECMLARVSLSQTFEGVGASIRSGARAVVLGASQAHGRTGAVPKMVEALLEWIDGSDAAVSAFGDAWGKLFESSENHPLLAWLGDGRSDEGTPTQDPSFPWPTHDGARFVVSLILSLGAARALKRDGRLEDAARESLQVAETVARWLLAARVWSRLEGQGKIGGVKWLALVGWIAVYAVEKAQLWWQLSRRASTSPMHEGAMVSNEHVKGSLVTGITMPHAVGRLLTVLQIGFAATAESLNQHDRDVQALCADIGRMFASVGGNPDDPHAWLRQSVGEYLYPMTHQLYGLKILIDWTTLTLTGASSEIDLKEWWPRIEALIRTDAEYHGRERFTYSDIGLTLGVACVVARELRRNGAIHTAALPTREDVARVRSDAIEHLDRAEESFSLRRAYQLGITDLYYLHDDFNDRRLHYNRAAEMAASELIAALLERLRQDARDDNPAQRRR